MRRLLLALTFALASCGGSSLAFAQQPHTIAQIDRVRFVAFKPNCNVLQRRFDPVWVNGWGWTMPRVGWHVLYPTLNYGIAKTLTKVGVSRKWAAIGATAGLGLIPHVRQAALGLKHGGVYELNLPDWGFDLWNRSLPTWDMLSHKHGHTKREYLTWIAGDLALACVSSP